MSCTNGGQRGNERATTINRKRTADIGASFLRRAAVAVFVMFFGTGAWSPTLDDPTTDPGVSSSYYSADSSYLPATWSAAGP